MAQANETKTIELTALNRAYIRAAVTLKTKSIERAMKHETNPEIIRIRSEELKECANVIAKL